MDDEPKAPDYEVLLPGGKVTMGERLAGPKSAIGASILINAASYSFFFALLTLSTAVLTISSLLVAALYPFNSNPLPLLICYVFLAGLFARIAGALTPRINGYYLQICEKSGKFELDRETKIARLNAMKTTGRVIWLATSIWLFWMLVRPVDLFGVVIFSTIFALNLVGQTVGQKRLIQNLDVIKLQPQKENEPKLEEKSEKPALKVVVDNTEASAISQDATATPAPPAAASIPSAESIPAPPAATPAKAIPIAIAEPSIESLLLQVKTAKNSQEANALAYKCLLKMKPKKPPKPDGEQVHALVDELIRIKRNNDADKISAHYLELLEAD
ncbi:MAG: hypothetical protein J0M35_20975 [Candidatus Obscuribacter phosphatis]|uniref:Uncharacterized protein n=1 Tax=Candidatus Obscuribacter phosphatis TaxID=1906157 RepID=A0A8J7PAG2_9BACT|nr:hypothetical protein [Candidatus Obscuribacter phosphatis]